MDESSPDVMSKYQKLAAEYSKLRAQVAVLKKAVSEEQAKNYELKEALKDKDQSMRKLEQELECLNFRNLQLTKRITVLQNDLEEAEDRAKKTKSKPPHNLVPTSSETHSILNTELLSRIEENERLHQQVFESEVQYKKVTTELTMKVEKLESQLQQQHSSLSDIIKKQEETIEKLSQERAKFELTLKNYEKDIKEIKSKDEICKQELEFVKQDLGSKLEKANRVIEEKVLFNNTRWRNLNSLNVPVLLHQKQDQLAVLIVDLKGVVIELVRRLSDLHTYMEQKVQSMEVRSETAAPINKLAFFLRDNMAYLKIIEGTFTDFSSNIQRDSAAWLDISSLKAVSSAFSKYVRYLDKLLPYLLYSIQAEDSSRGTTPRLKEIYGKLQIVSRVLIIGFSKLERYIKLLVEVGCPNKSITYCVSRHVLIKKIIDSVYSIHLQFEEARKIFGAKAVLDNELPTANETAKTTDDCILSSLVSISNGLKKITLLLEEKINVLDCEVPYMPRGVRMQKKINIHPCVPEFRERGLKYLTLLHQDEPPSIPCVLALKHSQMLNNYADCRENLTQQLQACQNKLAKLELDKEHWMVECQLLKTKQSKMSPSSIGNNGDSSPDEDEAFQIFVKSSVNQLVSQVQLADSKALMFQSECECLYQKLKLAEQKKEILEKEVGNAKETIGNLKEEQRTLVKNYEDQLSTMSEHLATMNETLTLQKDEIDALKHAGSNKVSKKSNRK